MQASEPRRSERVAETTDLHAAVRNGRGRPHGVRVEDLGTGGMAVSPPAGLRVDDLVRFEFWGSAFAWSGVARVVHVEEDRAGLAFMSWDGPAYRPLRRLVRDRVGA